MSATTTNHATPVQGQLADKILRPNDPGYERAVAAWNLAWTHRPAAVALPETEDDVAAAIRWARREGLGIAVQTTGHGVTVPADAEALLVVMAGLGGVHVDPAARTATVGGGVTWAPVLAAAQQHGLAPLVGSTPHVGAVGYTLGGGFGWLARKHGLAVDGVVSLRVVTADGSARTASREENEELYWGLCGSGGGNLGVVVAMTVRLHPVTQVYGGSLLYPVEAAADVFARFQQISRDASEDLTSAFNITAFPPLDIVPEPVRGKTFAILRGCHAGDMREARALVDEWRRWREPVLDLFGEMPFSRVAEISQDPIDPVPAATVGRWLGHLDDEVGAVVLDAFGGESPSPMLLAETRQAGGAVARPNPAVSYEARDGSHALELVGLLVAPGAEQALDDIHARTWQRLSGVLAQRPGYLNFAEGHERRAVAPQSFSADTWRRLAALKERVDPDGLFRYGI